jgi:hypothetical protein
MEYASGRELTFSINPIGDNVVETVTFNGETLVAVDGVYTLTVAPMQNVLEVVYKAPVVEEDSSSSSEVTDDVDSSKESASTGGLDLTSCFSGIGGAGMMLGALVCSAVAMLRKKEDKE